MKGKEQFNWLFYVFLVICEELQGYQLKAYGVQDWKLEITSWKVK